MRALSLSRQSKPADMIIEDMEQNSDGTFAKVLASGKTYNLQDLASSENMNEVYKILKKNLPNDYVEYFITNEKKFVLIDAKIPDASSFYIPRLLSNNLILDKSIFEKDCCDVFVFKGMERYQISKLADDKNQDSVSSDTQRAEITSRFIFLAFIEDWEAIRKIANVPAHLIIYEPDENRYILEDSNQWSEILQFSENDTNPTCIISEDEFIQQTLCHQRAKSFVCILDMPGMGKTELLASIARKILDTRKKYVTAFVKLAGLINKTERPLRCIKNPSKYLTSLLSHITPSTNTIILRSLIENNFIRIQFIFDEFDELQPEERKYVLHLMKQITSSFVTLKFFNKFKTPFSSRIRSFS